MTFIRFFLALYALWKQFQAWLLGQEKKAKEKFEDKSEKVTGEIKNAKSDEERKKLARDLADLGGS